MSSKNDGDRPAMTPDSQNADAIEGVQINEFIKATKEMAEESGWTFQKIINVLHRFGKTKKIKDMASEVLDLFGWTNFEEDVLSEGEGLREENHRLTNRVIALLEEKEVTKRKKTAKASLKWLGDGRLRYDSEEYLMKGNTQYARVSGEIYTRCQRVGSKVPTKDIYDAVRGDERRPYVADPIGNWKWLYQAVRSANRWAERNKLKTLFVCTKEEIQRMI